MKWYCNPRLLARLAIRFADGGAMEVCSDGEWRQSDGAVTANCIYNGFAEDGRLRKKGWDDAGYDDSGWAAAAEVAAPCERIEPNPGPPIRVIRTLRPVRFLRKDSRTLFYDFGENTGGRLRVCVSGRRGATVTLRHAENAGETGALDTRTNQMCIRDSSGSAGLASTAPPRSRWRVKRWSAQGRSSLPRTSLRRWQPAA